VGIFTGSLAIKEIFMTELFNHSLFQTLGQLGISLIIVLGTVFVANIIRRMFSHYFEKSSELLNVDAKQYVFIKHLITAAIYLCGIGLAIYLIPPLRNLSLSIFAGSGILAVVIGFASQQSLANIVSGLFITIFKPFRVGDRIKLTGKEIVGTVEDISLRHTVIKTFENKRVIIPNSVISTEVIENANIVEEKICKFIEMGISYDSDIDKAIQIMRDEAMKHPDIIDNRDNEEKEKNEPVVNVRVIGFGDSSVNLRAWVWTNNQPTAFKLGCDLYKNIKERFDREGIEIPFPHRTIVYKDKQCPSGE